MNPVPDLVRRARAGEKIGLIQKIEAETDLDQLNGMQTALPMIGYQPMLAELQAFSRRRAELRKAAIKRT